MLFLLCFAVQQVDAGGVGFISYTHKDHADPVFTEKVVSVLSSKSATPPYAIMQTAFDMMGKLKIAMLSNTTTCCVVLEPWKQYFDVVDMAARYEAATSKLDRAALCAAVNMETFGFHTSVMSVQVYAKMLADSKMVSEMGKTIQVQLMDNLAVLFRLLGCKVKFSRNKNKMMRQMSVDSKSICSQKVVAVLALCPSLSGVLRPLLKE